MCFLNFLEIHGQIKGTNNPLITDREEQFIIVASVFLAHKILSYFSHAQAG